MSIPSSAERRELAPIRPAKLESDLQESNASPGNQGLLITAALLTLGLLLVLQLTLAVVRQPGLLWNEIRWARSLALADGMNIYPGQHEPGPIIGTLHTPLSHVFYRLAVGWISDPAFGIALGSAVTILVVFGAVAWLLIRARPKGRSSWIAVLPAFLFCGFAAAQSPSVYAPVTSLHTDGCALAFATIACGLIYLRRDKSNAAVWLAGAAIVLGIWSKQTMAPVAVALAVFIWLADGFRTCRRFVVGAVVCGAAILAITLAFVPPSQFFFNVVTLAGHRPYRSGAGTVLVQDFRTAKLDSLTALFPLAFFLAQTWTRLSSGPRFRELLARCRWLVFVFASVSLIPGAVKAAATIGADINHLGLVLFPLLVAASLVLQREIASDETTRRRAALLFLTVGLLVNVTPASVIALPGAVGEMSHNDSATALRFARRHPREAYFPWNPSVSLLTEGKLYHFDMALNDREIAGYPLSDRQIQSGLPARFRYVALPPGYWFNSAGLARVFSSYKRTSLAELPGWPVYERPD